MDNFLKYARPDDEFVIDTFMLVDAEIISARLRSEMDASNVKHIVLDEELEDEMPAWDRRKRFKRHAPVMPMVPVVKLYGVCANGASVCIDMFGFYPHFRLAVSKGPVTQQTLAVTTQYLEQLMPTTSTRSFGHPTRKVVYSGICMGFPAFPYTPEPMPFLEFKLNDVYASRKLAEHFVTNPEYVAAGIPCRFVPHSAEDALIQCMVNKEMTGFGWLKVLQSEPPEDNARRDVEQIPCNILHDATATNIVSVPECDTIAPLRVLGIDIECIKDEGIPCAERNPVIIIGAIACTANQGIIDLTDSINFVFTWSPPNSGGVEPVPEAHHVIACSDETAMFVAFGQFLSTFDPDVFVGHNLVGFDIPYLVTRANCLGVEEIMHMGRRRRFRWAPPRTITRVRKNGDTRTSLRADTPGRIQLDTLTFVQGVRKESSYKLGALAQKYLNDGKDDVGYQMINPLWRQSPSTRARLCHYCLKDVRLSMGLAAHKEFEMLLAIVELSRGTRVLASRLLSSGNQEKVKTLVLNQARTPNFCPDGIPVFFPYEPPKTRDKDDKFKGATVISPQRGVHGPHQPVAVGDFSSLYPSIMISHNICYTTMLTDAQSSSVPHDTAPTVGARFVHSSTRTGLLPKILEGLLNRRNQAKAMITTDPDPAHKRMYNSRQLQLKVIANSVYGVLSASGGWFVRMEMGESVTSWGREMIFQARTIAEAEPFNAQVIYGDTDSIMMIFPNCTAVDDAFQRLDTVCTAITKTFPKPVSMAPEKVYVGHIQFGKKRYAGYMHTLDGHTKVDSKGVEKNRLDNCPLVRRVMSRVFDILLIENNLQKALDFVKSIVADLIHHRIDMADLVVTKSISKGEYKAKTVHIEVAKRMKSRDGSYSMAPGERIPFVFVTENACKGVKVCERAEDPLWAIQHGMEIDSWHYINNISKPLARVFMWYVVPREMLKAIRHAEQLDDEKLIKKHIDKMTNWTVNHLFGPNALSDISRPPAKFSGPMAKFLTRPKQHVDPAKLENLRTQRFAAQKTCTKCRGREDDTVQCVQRDCANLFKLALLTREIEDLTTK